MSSLYRPILKQAWQLTWRHKFLWLFGFFAAWIGTAGEYDFIIRGFELIREKSSVIINIREFIVSTGIFSAATSQGLKNLVVNSPWSLIPLIILLLIFILAVILIIWAIITSQNGLITSIKSLAGGKTTNFQEGLSIGMAKFWPVFWLNVIYKLVIFILFLTLGVIFTFILATAFADLQYWIGFIYLILFFVGFIIFIPLIIAISFVIRYAICYIVIKNYRLGEAIKRGISLFINNWLISLELAFILLMLYLAASILLLLLTIAIIAPLILLLFTFISIKFIFAANFIVLLALIIFLMIAIIAVSIFSTFLWSCWTLLFIQLTEKGGSSKLVRITANFPSYLGKKAT